MVMDKEVETPHPKGYANPDDVRHPEIEIAEWAQLTSEQITVHPVPATGPGTTQRGKKMNKIEAIIKPFKLDEVKEALAEDRHQGMTVTEVKGFGRQKGSDGNLQRQRIHGRLRPKNKLEIVVADDTVDRVVKSDSRNRQDGQNR